MKRLPSLFSAFICLVVLGICSAVWAMDVVYLKDGSIIHGTITEEVPGVSIKIQTNDGNVFVYKVKQIKKITHSVQAQDEENGTNDTGNGDNGEEQAPVHKRFSRSQNAVSAVTPVPDDPNAKFNKFGFLLNVGFWAPGVYNEFNSDLEAGTGSNSYDFLPGYAKFGLGLGWFTNGLGLKWNVQFSFQPNDYSTDWYYGGYYAGTTTENTYILAGGSELEADLDFDKVTNKDTVTSLYVPLILGVWEVEYNITTSYGSDDFTATTTDFGSGIGFRGFDASKFMWDIQVVYRACSRGNYLTDAYGDSIPSVDGKYIDANVSGLDLNFTVGFLM